MQASCLLICSLLAICGCANSRKPNFIVIFADDMGYGDLHSYGHPTQEKGPIDVLADEGMRFTQWYAADSLCTPSRAALLTGRLPIRSGMVGTNRVLWQVDSGGLPKNETTIAEALKRHGYKTGMVGKWHLGINEFVANDGNHLPQHHGFDFVGALLPYTFHIRCDPSKFTPEEQSVKCYLYQNSTFKEQPINTELLTKRITSDAVQFVEDNRENQFFLYMSMPQVHEAVICSKKFCNTSRRGVFGDFMNEMAWSVGQVVDTVRRLHLEEDTLVMFLSDHGPQLEQCSHGGSPGFLKGGKATTWEGGIRVPSIAWWPGKIPPMSTNRHVVSTMDIYPTLLALAGEKDIEGTNNILDGVRIDNLLHENHTFAEAPHEILFHYCSDNLFAVRLGKYKIHYFSHDLSAYDLSSNCPDGNPDDDVLSNLYCSQATSHDPPIMFNVENDPGERYPLDPARHQDVLDRAAVLIEEHRATLQVVPSQLNNHNPALQPCCNPPSCRCSDYEDAVVVDTTDKTEL